MHLSFLSLALIPADLWAALKPVRSHYPLFVSEPVKFPPGCDLGGEGGGCVSMPQTWFLSLFPWRSFVVVRLAPLLQLLELDIPFCFHCLRSTFWRCLDLKKLWLGVLGVEKHLWEVWSVKSGEKLIWEVWRCVNFQWIWFDCFECGEAYLQSLEVIKL